MLIQRQKQRGMVGRVVTGAIGWLSLVLVVVGVTPLVPRATLHCQGYPAFVERCKAAIEDIRNSTPVGEAMIENLDNSRRAHVILDTSVPLGSKNVPVNRFDAHDLDSQVGSERGTGEGTSSITQWNSTDTSRLPSDGVPQEPTATLQHELYHANLADQGGYSSETIPDAEPATFRDEVDATIVENEYRRAKDLEPRVLIGGAFVPQPDSED